MKCQQGELLSSPGTIYHLLVVNCPHLLPLLGASHTGVFTMVHLNVCSLMDDVVASIVLPKHLENVLFI